MKFKCATRGCCKGCGTTERRHCGFGYCTTCRHIKDKAGKWPALRRAARTCSADGCDKPMKARGWCKSHYPKLYGVERVKKAARQAWRWKHDPEFRARKARLTKKSQMMNEGLHERHRLWKIANPIKSKMYADRAKRLYRTIHGCCRAARFQPKARCTVFANGKDTLGILQSPAFRYKGSGGWKVPILLPWGETVVFKTSEVKVV